MTLILILLFVLVNLLFYCSVLFSKQNHCSLSLTSRSFLAWGREKEKRLASFLLRFVFPPPQVIEQLQSFPIGVRRTRARRISPSKGRTSSPPGDDKGDGFVFLFFFTLLNYVLWYCIRSVLVYILYLPSLFTLLQLLSPFLCFIPCFTSSVFPLILLRMFSSLTIYLMY